MKHFLWSMVFYISTLSLISVDLSFSQLAVSSYLLSSPWSAQWITHPTASRTEYGVFHFRKTFHLERVPEHFTINITAVPRYQLYVNGHYINEGPSKGDLDHWKFETIDIAPYLVTGQNVMAALLINFAELAPESVTGSYSQFLVQGNTADEKIINSDTNWKVKASQAYHGLFVSKWATHGFYVAAPGDSVMADKYDWGWETPDYDDHNWINAAPSIGDGLAVPRGFIYGNPPFLVPRTIPLMEKTKQRLYKVARQKGSNAQDSFLKGTKPVRIPAHTKAAILFDNGVNTIGYPELYVSQGKASKIKVTYAEALYNSKGKKLNRNEIDGKEISGLYDIYVLDGGEDRMFRPLWLRTFRYVQLDIETKDEALILNDYFNVFTAYPFERNAQFESGDERLDKIWEVGWRTARLCAGETFMDCPYHEQMQYLGDSRIQGLISLYLSGDDRLMRNAITDFFNSKTPEGILMCRYPTRNTSIIPSFPIWWIGMLHDYYMYRQHHDFVRQYLPAAYDVLNWYKTKLDTTQLMGKLPWWNQHDWISPYPSIMPGADESGSTINTLSYIYGLDKAAELFAYFGEEHIANELKFQSQKSKQALMKHRWD